MFKKLFGIKGDIDENSADKIIEENNKTENNFLIEEYLHDNEVNYNNEEEKSIGFFKRLTQGLSKTSKEFSQKLDKIFMGYNFIDENIYSDLEEALILSDVGFETAIHIVEELRDKAREKNIENTNQLKEEFKIIIKNILSSSKYNDEIFPNITVIIGVNGVGKTTTIGKLAFKHKKDQKKLLLAAADTFRAAAADQLEIWANRADVDLVRKNEGSDPSSVIFEAIQKAKNDNIDSLICDTAGRLHNKKNLMDELSKIFRIIDREYSGIHKEVYLVVDATTGQNALNQVRLFSEVTNLTGIILTKLDGTAKGGVVIGIAKEFNIPIKFIGVGEKIDDLQKFDPEKFAEALFLNI